MKSSLRRFGTKRPLASDTVTVTLISSTPLLKRNESGFCGAGAGLRDVAADGQPIGVPVVRRGGQLESRRAGRRIHAGRRGGGGASANGAGEDRRVSRYVPGERRDDDNGRNDGGNAGRTGARGFGGGGEEVRARHDRIRLTQRQVVVQYSWGPNPTRYSRGSSPTRYSSRGA